MKKAIFEETEIKLFDEESDSAARSNERVERELTQWKEQIISMISHEFRTPMSAILSSAELLEHYGHRLDEERRQEHLHRIQTAVKEMSYLLESIVLKQKSEPS